MSKKHNRVKLQGLFYSGTEFQCVDKHVLNEVLDASKIMKEEKKLTSRNLALVLIHDLLLANGIQTSDGAVKQAVLRHKTRLHSEFQRIKIKKGVKSSTELARNGDERAGEFRFSDAPHLPKGCTPNDNEINSEHTSLRAREHDLLVHYRSH